jgi:hypothetical protein
MPRRSCWRARLRHRRCPGRARRPGIHPRRARRRVGDPRRGHRGRGARGAARPRGAEPPRAVDDRPRLLRHAHAVGHRAQRLREPVLVHGVHALPARDLAGPLEALINFQTMVTDLTGSRRRTRRCSTRPPRSSRACSSRRASKSTSNVFLVDADALPQTKALLHHRAAAVGIEIVEGDVPPRVHRRRGAFGAFVQYPGASGASGTRPRPSPRCRRRAASSSSRPTCSR